MYPKRCLLFMILLLYTCAFAGIPRTLYTLNESAETVSSMSMDDWSIQSNIVTTGQMPNQLVVFNDLIYIVNSGTDDIMIIDPQQNNQVVQTIALAEGSNPWAIAFPDSDKAYVTNYVANTVSVIDLATGTVTGNIAVGVAPEGILCKDGQAFVTNTGYAGWGMPYEQSSVSIIDAENDMVIHTVNTPVNAQDVAIAPDGRLNVVCTGDYATTAGSVVIIDLHTGDNQNTPAAVDTVDFGWHDAEHTTPFTPGDLVITVDGKGYCPAWGDGVNGYICSYDANTGTALRDASNPILVGPNLQRLFYDNSLDVVWVPYMKEWGGDGHVQKLDVQQDTIIWESDVIGNGTKDLGILEAIDGDPTGIHPQSQIPATIELAQNYPNPFNPTTTLSYSITQQSNVELSIYNNMGQRINTLVHQTQSAGSYQIEWNGCDANQSPVASGIYYYELCAGNTKTIRKMTLIR